MAAFDFPSSPNNGDTYSANGIDWIYNGSVWKKDATAGVKGQKGEVGVTGDKGQKGEKGEVGPQGDKGQKGEIGATGGSGGTGSQGDKGQKGEVGAAATKGQKGEIGATGGSGGTGSTGDKGQKGDEGSAGSTGIPVATIVAYGGNSAPSGWLLCDGGGTGGYSALAAIVGSSVPDLRNRFIIGAGSSYSVDAIGGSAHSVVVSHSHTINNHTHSFSASTTGGNHNHQYIDQYVVINNGYRPWPASNNDCAQRNINTSGSGSHSHSISGTTGNPSDTGTNSQGESGTNKNLPPYYALTYIIKT